MARKFVVDDSEWYEVKYINGYAVFMGYLMMGIRGLGILVITWTTVVLLGGFISDLGKKDFWCLTGITLVQSAGVFNFVLDETMSDLVHSGWGLLVTSFATISKPFYKVIEESELVHIFLRLLVLFLSGIQALVLVIILCPVVVLFVFGIYISAGVGLWCLIQQDFGNTDGAANLKSSLQVLYSLAVAQGVLYGYKQIHAFGAKFGLAEFVAKKFLSMDKDLVTAYLEETVTGCEKDPSFATGRNLVTYALDLMMDAKSNDGFMAGVKVLGTILIQAEPSRKVLAKHLLTRPSCPFGHLVQRLLETLGPRSPYSGQIRLQAAMIVELVASSILLEEHPEWIHYILSLLDTFEEYSWRPEEYSRHGNLPTEYERGWLLEKYERCWLVGHRFVWQLEEYERESHFERTNPAVENTTSKEGASSDLLRVNYMRLVGQGFIVLQKLAVHPKNSRIIVNTEGPLAKMATPPVNSRQLHNSERRHYLWTTMVEEYFNLMIQLAGIPGETGEKVRDEISARSKEIMTTLESILECLECPISQKIGIVQDLLHLPVDESSLKAGASSCKIITWVLLLIFLLQDEFVKTYLKKSVKIIHESSGLAGEKKLSSNQELPLQQSVDYVLGDLAKALVSAEDISTRVHAAGILEFLISQYTKDDEYLKELKNTMVSVMPEVLKEILGRGSTGEAETKAANNVQPSSSQEVDLEKGGVSGGGEGCKQTSASLQQTEDATGHIERRLRNELRDLCWTIQSRWQWDNENADVTLQLDEIAEKVQSDQGKPVKTFKKLVREEMRYCC